MKHNSDFLQNFMAYFSYPEIAVSEFTRIFKRLDDEPEFGSELDAVVNGYMFPEADGMGEALEKVKAMSEKYGENEYTMYSVFILSCVPILKERYDKAGISEKLFYDSTADFKYKIIESIEVKGVPGAFSPGWNDGTFKMKRFAFGRFQYELKIYDWENDFVTSCGKVMKVGDTYVNFHIPSSGVPLTDEVRLASYKEAYQHYKHLFPDGKVIFGCGSWLLYPRHREFLPPHSNILKFMDDFDVVGWAQKDEFGDAWRVFGRYAGLPPEQLPRDTSLRRAYADWLMKGNKTGDAFCVFVFDGEKILKKAED